MQTTPGKFGAPGSRHIVWLTDGTSVEEEALERDETASFGRFRYIVWNYATPKARPVAYGVGEFHTVQVDSTHTRITWTYSNRDSRSLNRYQAGAQTQGRRLVRFIQDTGGDSS